MASEYKFGLMEPSMKETGETMLPLAEASSITSTAMYMMVSCLIFIWKIGEWENDKANGYGVYHHSNGS
jgi:hypothetical protein